MFFHSIAFVLIIFFTGVKGLQSLSSIHIILHVKVNKSAVLKLVRLFSCGFIPGADDGGALFRLSDWFCGLPGTLPERHHGSKGF